MDGGNRQKDRMIWKRNSGDGGENQKILHVQPAAVLPAAHPAEVKPAGSCRKYSVLRLQHRVGGACVHKTDGKLF